ncbi:Maf-like protein [Hydrogenophaga sp. 5NK40-0174]
MLSRLHLDFDTVAPDVDESPRSGEAPDRLAVRLALAKARDVASRNPEAVVIGSDQVADLAGNPLGKPGTHERATAQLKSMSGQTVIFQTAVAVVCAATGYERIELAPVKVVFRSLSDEEIESYLRAEQPYDCAGSAKSEGLGIALLDRIDNDDPTALIGLPLIRTARMLREAGIRLLPATQTD